MTTTQPTHAVEELEREKQLAAVRAVEFVQSGMVVGLGGGSTAAFAVQRIAELLRNGRLHHIGKA